MEVMQKVIALKQRLEELKSEQYEIESQLYDLRKEVEPKAKYGNVKAIVDPNYRELFDNKNETYEAVRLVDYLLNRHERDAHMKIFGQINGDWKEQRNSVTYYRNEYGVLNHKGGGWVLMRDGIPCNDEEWESIKKGNIPDKFRNKGLM